MTEHGREYARVAARIADRDGDASDGERDVRALHRARGVRHRAELIGAGRLAGDGHAVARAARPGLGEAERGGAAAAHVYGLKTLALALDANGASHRAIDRAVQR